YGMPMDYYTFIDFENKFYTWGHNESSAALYQPDNGDYSVNGLYDQLTTHAGMEDNLKYIDGFINTALGLPRPSGGNALANPRTWSICANADVLLCLENPLLFHKLLNTTHLDDIITDGNNVNLFLNQLVAYNTNAPNTNLWSAVCDGYRSAVQGFT